MASLPFDQGAPYVALFALYDVMLFRFESSQVADAAVEQPLTELLRALGLLVPRSLSHVARKV